MRTLRAIRWIVLKDVTTELRTRETLASTVFFAILVLVVFNFAFDPGQRDVTVVGPGILWIAFLFAAFLAMNRLMLDERDQGGLQGLMLCPVDRSSLYLAKCCILFLVLTLTEVVTLALFVLFFDLPVGSHLLGLGIVLPLGTLGLVALGTTFSAMAVHTRTRELMLPLLMIPIAVPLLLAVVQVTAALLRGGGLADERSWLELLAAFDVIFLGVGYLTFPAILEE